MSFAIYQTESAFFAEIAETALNVEESPLISGGGISIEDNVISISTGGIIPNNLAPPVTLTGEEPQEGQILLYTDNNEGAKSWQYEPFSSAVAGVTSITPSDGLTVNNTTGNVNISIEDDAISTSKLQDSSVINSKIAPNAVTSDKIQNESISVDKFTKPDNFEEVVDDQTFIFDHTDNNWKTGSIDKGVSSIKSNTPSQIQTTTSSDGSEVIINLEENSINDTFLAGGAVTSNKIADLAVFSAKLGDKSVETAKIDDLAVTNEKLADSSISTEKLQDESVSTSKLSAPSVKTSAIASLLTYVSNSWAAKRFSWNWNSEGGKLSQNEVDAEGNIIDGGVTLADLTMNTFENNESNSNAIRISGLNADAGTTYTPEIERTAIYVESGTSTLTSSTLPATLTVSNSLYDTSGGGNLAAGLDLRVSPMKFSNIKYFFPVQEQLTDADPDLFMNKSLVVSEVKFDIDTDTGKYIPNLYFQLQ